MEKVNRNLEDEETHYEEMPMTKPTKYASMEARQKGLNKNNAFSAYFSKGWPSIPSELEILSKASKEERKLNSCQSYLRRNTNQWNHEAWKNNLCNGILNIPHLKLDEIPESIYTYDPPITVAYIHDNKIGTLPENFFENMPMLGWLDLRNNRLTELPKLKVEHKNLRVLNLKGNNLICLPYSLVLAIRLKSIEVENTIKDPPEATVNQGTLAILEYLNEKYQAGAPAYDYRKHGLLKDISDESSESEFGETDEEISTRISNGISEVTEIFKASSHQTSATQPAAVVDDNFRQKFMNNHEISSNSIFPSKPLGLGKDVYSMKLWQDVPYEGHSAQKIVDREIEDHRTQEDKKCKEGQEIILQRMKDRDVLSKWRQVTRRRQQERLDNPIEGNASAPQQLPFGTDADIRIYECRSRNVVSLDEFDKEFNETLNDLRGYSQNPTSDLTEAKRRLDKIQEVRKRLLNMRIESEKPLLQY